MATKQTKQMIENEPSFEEALARLEEVVRLLESGAETLDASLKLYEEGVSLVRLCTGRLAEAEQRVKVLGGISADGAPLWNDFSGEDEA